jgi:hypothetical protein
MTLPRATLVDLNRLWRDALDAGDRPDLGPRGPYAIDCRICGFRMGEIMLMFDRSGEVLHGTSYFIDVRMVERSGRHPETGLPRYGPAARQYAQHRGPRGKGSSPRYTWPTMASELQPRDFEADRHHVIDTAFWGYCPECNAGQVVQLPED